ncbi:MAG: apolipoprotein N-acyltransferase [Rickettsiales bacterium]|nr:apolipoprotein N-acyltransferase [Rickettsiales bacterium]
MQIEIRYNRTNHQSQLLTKVSILKNKLFLAFLIGLISAISFAPIDFFPTIIISVASLFLLINNSNSNIKSFKIGFFYGFGYFLSGIYWVSISLLVDPLKFGWLIPFALIIIPSILAINFALMTLFYNIIINKIKRFSTKKPPLYYKYLIFSILWLLCELIRFYIIGRFPWQMLGYSLISSENFSQIASIFGTFGLSCSVLLISSLPLLILSLQFKNNTIKIALNHKENITASIIAITIIITSFIYGVFHKKSIVEIDYNQQIRLVQGNIKQTNKWIEDEKMKNLIKHIRISQEDQNPNLSAIIWPETAIPFPIYPNSEIIEFLAPIIPEKGSLISGAVRISLDQNNEIKELWNSIIAINKKLNLSTYDKHHLVPFGEFVPFQKFIPFIQKLTGGMMDFSSGRDNKIINLENNISFRPLICYEIIFFNDILDNFKPSFIAHLTNDSWFGNSSGPYQHLAIARIRAIENGIMVARVANTGISAIIDPFGKIINKINLNEEGKIDSPIIKAKFLTLYQKYQHLPFLIFILSLLIIATIIVFRDKNKNY